MRNVLCEVQGNILKAFYPEYSYLTVLSLIALQGGDLRYCQKCSHYKPPRAHHCRVCKRCVLRMDHHCVWINNCVGHANYKVFLVFVLYVVIACIHSMVLLFGSVVHDMHKDQQQNGGSFRTSYIICGVLLIPLTLALSVLLGWHIYLILHNKTTIEYHEGVRAMWLAEKVGNIYRHPFDLGVYENLVSVKCISWHGLIDVEFCIM
ncbi:probable protein S-acyltransferase 16 [Asparagus officinalis]|uniref:probable protein S-acyltransferase 16 n=1 Tax=Asparagus officinalis TaxID=4686 RepID=UPI00098E6E07|nr:probable protein S-acyltransferase 16 [Asparagus officinalis]